MILVLDFDGVVVDSTMECMLISHEAFYRFSQIYHRPSKFKSTITEDKELFFKKRRKFVRGAPEYLGLWDAFTKDDAQQINFTEQIQKANYEVGEIQKFVEIFFETREKYKNESLDDWINLHLVAPALIATLKQIPKSNLYFATLKDAKSVQQILRNFGVSVPASRIYDHTKIKNKLEAIKLVLDAEQCPKNDILYVDDILSHLLPVANYGVRCILAEWFNVTDQNFENINIRRCYDAKELNYLVEATLGK